MSSIQGVMVCRSCSYEIIFNNFTADGLDVEMIAHLEANPTHIFELVYRLEA